MNAIDTNVLVYFLDSDEPTKQARAQQLFQQLTKTPDTCVLLWQVAGEFLNNLRKRQAAGKITSTDVEAHFQDFVKMFPLQLPDDTMFANYFAMYSRFSLSHWDAMLLAACKAIGVTTLYSEDLDDKTDYDGVSVVNPFP